MSNFIIDPPPAFSPVSAFDAHLDRVRLLIRENPADAGLQRSLRLGIADRKRALDRAVKIAK